MRRSAVPVLAVLATLCAPVAMAAETLAGPVTATVLEVIDGDTVAVRARIWLGQAIEIRVRLAGIDTPELRGRCPAESTMAARARDALSSQIAGRQVTLSDIRYGTYAGRVVARMAAEDAVDIGQILLDSGLARAYAGRGPRPDWCNG